MITTNRKLEMLTGGGAFFECPRWLEAMQRGLDTIADGPSVGDLPLMWIHGEDDQLVPIERSRAGIAHLRGSHLAERTYPEARHELFNELNADNVIGDVTEFIRTQVATG